MSTQEEGTQGPSSGDTEGVDVDEGGGGPGEVPTTEMDQEITSLECSICLQPCIHPVELPCSHIFCFLCVKGVAMQGQSRCAICRAPIPPIFLTHPKLKDISQLYKHTKADHEWFYEARGGGWWQYDERSMQELDKAFESGVSTFQLLIAGHLYEIDFTNMLQYRSNNRNMSRRIKRDAAESEKRGVAGIRLDQSGTEPDHQSSNGNNRGNPRGRRGGGTTPTASTARGGAAPSSQSQQSGSQSTATPGGGESRTNAINNGNGVEVLSSGDEGVDSDDPDYLEEEDDEMELGEDEEELEESEHSEDDEDDVRDGARAPTARSDRSTSSNNTQTPPPSSGGTSSSGGGTSASSPGLQNGSSSGRRSSNSSGRGRRGATGRRSSTSGGNSGVGGSGTTQNQVAQSGASSSSASSPSPLLGSGDGGGGIRPVGGSNIRLSPAPPSHQLPTKQPTAVSDEHHPSSPVSATALSTTTTVTSIVVGPGVRITVEQQLLPMPPPDEDEEIL